MKAFVVCIFSFCFISHSISQEYFRQEDNLGIVGNFGFDTWFGGGGVSFADFNQDGLDDLSFGTETSQNIKFYENKGNFFEEVNPPFVTNVYENRQIVWVDYDNDGDKDFFACAMNGPNLLYENDGNMVFTDVTAAKGLPVETKFTSGATFADIDEDGYLDIYITNMILPDGGPNEMWRWNPTLNEYEDYTAISGTGNGHRTSYCASFFDFDNDDDLDLYVINDFTHENSLYMNVGNGIFIDISVPSMTNIVMDAMNAGIGDYDNDHDLDIYITDTEDAVLFENNGDNTFSDVTLLRNVGTSEWSWTANFFDYDNDRDLDLYVSSEELGDPNRFFVNDGTGNFSQPLIALGGLAGEDDTQSHTHAIGDYNNDGKSDIMVSLQGLTNFRLYSNQDETGNNFVKLHLEGTESSKDAYGCMIDLWVGGVKTITQTHSTVAYHCQNSDYINLGLGTSSAIDSIVIHWPYGNNKDVLLNNDILINGMNEVVEGSGVVDNYYQALCVDNHHIKVNPIPSQKYGSVIKLNSTSEVLNGSEVIFQSESIIELDIGFEVIQGAVFEAEIEPCGN